MLPSSLENYHMIIVNINFKTVNMQWICLHLLILGFAVTVLGSALPDDYLRKPQVPSHDNTCGFTAAGNFKGYSCDPRGGNPCCGPSGYCGQLPQVLKLACSMEGGNDFGNLGISSESCGPGCQQDYGACIILGSTLKCGENYGRCIEASCCSSLGWVFVR